MKTVKPTVLGLLTRPFEYRRKFHLGVAVTAFVPLGDQPALLAETVMWPFLSGELPPDQPLDAIIPKAGAEFLAIAQAHAPAGAAVPALRVGIKLGTLTKTLGVFGERYFLDERPTEPKPFTTLPIDWAHAYGGPDIADNPLGLGAEPVETPAGRLLPIANILATAPGAPYRVPAGFAPLDQMWPSRARYAGTYGEAWLQEDFPGFPRDMDWRFFNTAPPDQQFPGMLRGDEDYALENLHPERPLLTGRLPGIAPRLFLRRKGGAALEEVPLGLTTVWFFPHQLRLVLVHHGRADLREEDGADIELALLGADRLGAPRPAAEYAEVLARRLDRNTGILLALQDDLLVPAELVVPDPALAESAAGMQREDLRTARQRRRMERAYAKKTAELVAAGVDPAQIPPLPEPIPVPGAADIPALAAHYKAMAETTKAGMMAQAQAAQAKAEPRFVQPGQNLQAILAQAGGKPKGPPTQAAAPDPAQRLAALRGKLLQMEATPPPAPGATWPEPLEPFDPAALQAARLADIDKAQAELAPPGDGKTLQEKQRDAYRITAHLQSPADRRPDQREELRRLIAADPGQARAAYDFSGADLAGLDLSGRDLSGICLDGADLSGCNFTGTKLVHAVLAHATLQGCTFDGADLTGANLGQSRCTAASFRNACLREAILQSADLRRASFAGADLEQARLLDALLEASDFSAARAPGLLIMKTMLKNWHAPGIQLEKAKFLEVDLTGADFSGAAMRKTVFLGCSLDQARFTGADLRKAVFVKDSTARGADFAQANLAGANLRETALDGADFSGANMPGADFSGAMLNHAKLPRVNATGARFTAAQMAQAALTHGNFYKADLARADLRGTDLSEAGLTEANLPRVILDTSSRTTGIITTRMRYLPRYLPPETA
jgi:uncharacterized protein YjbI with pentapeptide repeats